MFCLLFKLSGERGSVLSIDLCVFRLACRGRILVLKQRETSSINDLIGRETRR